MKMRSGFVQAAILALSTMLLPDGVGADEDSSPEYTSNPALAPTLFDSSDDDSDDSDQLGAVMDACKRQRQRFLMQWRSALKGWSGGREPDPQQRAINHLCLMVLLDLSPGAYSHVAKAEILAKLCREVPGEEIVEAMTRLVLEPGECRVPVSAPDLGLTQTHKAEDVRAACSKMVCEIFYSLRVGA